MYVCMHLCIYIYTVLIHILPGGISTGNSSLSFAV